MATACYCDHIESILTHTVDELNCIVSMFPCVQTLQVKRYNSVSFFFVFSCTEQRNSGVCVLAAEEAHACSQTPDSIQPVCSLIEGDIMMRVIPGLRR